MPLKASLLFSVAFIGIKAAADTHIKNIYVNFTLKKYVIIVQLNSNKSAVTDKQENNPLEKVICLSWVRKLSIRPLGSGRLMNRH